MSIGLEASCKAWACMADSLHCQGYLRFKNCLAHRRCKQNMWWMVAHCNLLLPMEELQNRVAWEVNEVKWMSNRPK